MRRVILFIMLCVVCSVGVNAATSAWAGEVMKITLLRTDPTPVEPGKYFDIYLQGGNGTPYERVRDIIVFPKGNDVEHTYTKQFQYYSDSDVVTNGLSVKMLPSDSGEIYDVIYFIQRTQVHI